MQPQTKVANAGTVGAAIGVLVVLFMPETVIIFTPETAATATAALGVVFGWGMAFIPKPGG